MASLMACGRQAPSPSLICEAGARHACGWTSAASQEGQGIKQTEDKKEGRGQEQENRRQEEGGTEGSHSGSLHASLTLSSPQSPSYTCAACTPATSLDLLPCLSSSSKLTEVSLITFLPHPLCGHLFL